MREKRTKHEGVYRLADGRYRVRGEYPDEKVGRNRELDRRIAAKDDLEAASIRARLLDEATARRGERKPDRTRLRDALDVWRTSKAPTLRASTADRYDTAIERWKGALGDYFLDRLDPDDVRAVLFGWRDNDRASETINGRLRILRTFAKETRVPWIVEGVRALETTVEEDEEDEDEGRGLDADELRELLKHGPGARRTKLGKVPRWWPRAWSLVATMAWTGLRFGEATALEWRDVDLEAGTLRVRRAQYRGVVGHPKAKASRRKIALTDTVVAVLREHREQMLRGQEPGVDLPQIFPSRIAGKVYVSNTHARKSMLAVCDAAKIDLSERPALHCLRHTMNNLVRQHATEEVRRSLIGHAEEVRTYTHVEEHEQRAAMGAVMRVIKGGG